MGVSEFYEGRSILITGVTGFMGKVLLEKLLRCCPGISQIYVLIRDKKANTAVARLKKLFASPLFSKLSTTRPNYEGAVTVINGDILEPRLGISQEGLRRLGDVSIIFHCAASVKFREHLRDAMRSNVQSVDELLTIITTEMKKVEVLVYLSTAFAYCYRKNIAEKLYPVVADPSSLLTCLRSVSPNVADKLELDLLQDHPNTYTFTKSLAENLLFQRSAKHQTVIVRPTIVTPAWKEPLPGWCDSWNGPVGLIVAFGKGLLRTLFGRRDAEANLMPVDVAANLIIASAWKTAYKRNGCRKDDLTIYNCATSGLKTMTWGELCDHMTMNAKEIPLKDPYRVPAYNSTISPNLFLHNLRWIFYQWLPAFAIDLLLRCAGKTPRLACAYRKISSMEEGLSYFTMRSWRWDTSNLQNLSNLMTENDKKTFFLDTANLDWKDYMREYHMGVKAFLLAESIGDVKETKMKIRRRISAGLFVKMCCYVILIFTLWYLLW